jgi:hypothetical protein
VMSPYFVNCVAKSNSFIKLCLMQASYTKQRGAAVDTGFCPTPIFITN